MDLEDTALLPIDIKEIHNKWFVVLASIPRTALTDPFLLDSLEKRFKLAAVDTKTPSEQDLLVRPLHYDLTDERIHLQPLQDFLSVNDGDRAPSSLRFIFHMSRCGSTLATQMLSTSNKFFVLSEPPIVNTLLDPHLVLPPGVEKMQVLQSVVSAMEACKPKGVEITVLKFRSWNTLFQEEILSKFPDTDWIYLHRNGLEVLESVLTKPPGWLRSRHTYAQDFAHMLNIEREELERLSDAEYSVRMLGKFCSVAAEHKSSRSRFLDYHEIISSLPHVVSQEWGTQLSPFEKDVMLERTLTHSKDLERATMFTPDGAIKRSGATEEQRALVESYVETARSHLMRSETEWTRSLRPKFL